MCANYFLKNRAVIQNEKKKKKWKRIKEGVDLSSVVRRWVAVHLQMGLKEKRLGSEKQRLSALFSHPQQSAPWSEARKMPIEPCQTMQKPSVMVEAGKCLKLTIQLFFSNNCFFLHKPWLTGTCLCASCYEFRCLLTEKKK